MRRTINGSAGLWTSANTELAPPGSLKQASGVVIKRHGIIEKLRSYVQYNSPEDSADFSGVACDGIGSYGSTLLLFDSQGNKVLSETAAGSGLFTLRSNTPNIAQLPYSGTKTDTAIHLAEANGNAYVTAKVGAIKFDAIASSGYLAGVPRGLDVQLTLVAAGTLLANTNAVAYRVLFGIKDANSNLVLGPPSGRATVTATAAQNVTVKAWIHSAITAASNATSYFVQVYRTAISTVSGVDPGEEMQLVYHATLTSADVASKFISFTDATPDALRGAALYASPSQDGIANANYPPPASVDIALFKGAMFYSNTTQKHSARLQLLGVGKNLLTISTGAGGITKSGGNGVYAFTGAPDLSNIPTDGTAKLSVVNCTSAANNGEFPITAVNQGAETITVTNAAAVTEAGTATARAFPSKLTIAGVNYYGVISATAETPASQLFKVSTGNAISGTGTPQQDVADTAASLLRVVNQQVTPVVYGHYESGPDDGAGKMVFFAVSQGASSFTISAAGTLWYNSFNPTIPTTAVVTSTNDSASNRLYFSKPNQPEHVPLGNYFDIGARSQPILRIIPLREALLVWKADGLFRVVGDGASFGVSAHDTTLILSNIGGVTTLNNRAYALTSRGVFVVTESSGSMISASVADQFRPFNDDFANGAYNGNCYTIASEVDQCVYFTNKTASAPFFTQMVYCVTTGAWTQPPQFESTTSTSSSVWGGVPALMAGRIFRLGTTTASAIMAETGFDTNETVLPYNPGNNLPNGIRRLINISAVNPGAHQITYTASTGIGGLIVGLLVKENTGGTGRLYVVTAVAGATVTLALYDSTQTDSFNFTTTGGTYSTRAKVYVPITATVEWLPFTAGDDGAYARTTEVSALFDGNSSVTAATMSAYTEATTTTAIGSLTTSNTPFPTGIKTQRLFRCLIPSNMQMARRLSIVFSHSSGVEVMLLSGISYEFTPLIDPNELT